MAISYSFKLRLRNKVTGQLTDDAVVAADAAGALTTWMTLGKTTQEVVELDRAELVSGVDSDSSPSGGDFMSDGSVPMTGNLDAGGFEVTNAHDPTSAQSLVTRAYGDTHYSGSGGGGGDFLADGSVPMTGALNLGSHKATNMAVGTTSSDGATFGQLPTSAQLVPTLPADATKFLDGTGAFSTPAGSGGGSGYPNPGDADLSLGSHNLAGVGAVNADIKTDANYNFLAGPLNIMPTGSPATSNTGFGTTVLGGAAGSPITGYSNSAFGEGAGGRLTSGHNNNFFGNNAGALVTSGNEDSAFGQDSLVHCTTGSANSAFGVDALNATTGNFDTGVGHSAGKTLTSGSQNTLVGRQAGGRTLTTGDQNTIIGEQADVATGSTSGAIAIGAGATAKTNEICIGSIENLAPTARWGSGAPVDGSDPDGSFYYRFDGTVAGHTAAYHAEGGVWVAMT